MPDTHAPALARRPCQHQRAGLERILAHGRQPQHKRSPRKQRTLHLIRKARRPGDGNMQARMSPACGTLLG